MKVKYYEAFGQMIGMIGMILLMVQKSGKLGLVNISHYLLGWCIHPSPDFFSRSL